MAESYLSFKEVKNRFAFIGVKYASPYKDPKLGYFIGVDKVNATFPYATGPIYRVQQDEGTPIRGELNPNHPVTREMREQWHKLLAIIMHKHGLTNVQITPDDVQRMGEFAVMADARGKEFWVRLLPKDEAEKLCRAAGGLVV